MHDWWRRTLARERARLRKDGRAGLLWSLRITLAAVASYLVALLFLPGTQPLLAPLTAMLVTQVTPVSLLASGLDRVISVVSGVFLAVVFAAVVPLEWWSLGILIFVSISIGQVLKLQSNLIEVAISAMLVLGVGSLATESAAWERIAETLVGAAVGVLANLVFPAKVPSADASRAIDGLADSISALLTRAADELTTLAEEGRDVAPTARTWLDDARRITHDIPQVGAALLAAEQGRRLNVRAVGTSDVGPGLRQGLEALEHAAVAIRGMFRSVADASYDPSWLDKEQGHHVWLGLAQTLRELAAGVDAFGQLVRDESNPTVRLTSSDLDALRASMDGLREARARLEDTLTAGGASDLLELNAAVLATVKRLQREMDLDERVRRQVRMLRPRRPLHRPPRSAAPAGGPTEPSPDTETQLMPPLREDHKRRPKG